MSYGYKIVEPSGRSVIAETGDRHDVRRRVNEMQEKWSDYCERNWLNDSGDLFSPETKVKRFLDTLSYFFLIGNMSGIETDYKQVMHAKREIPASNCPSSVDNLLYGSGSVSDAVAQEEWSAFNAMTERLDANAQKYETQKASRQRRESLFSKHNRLGIRGGEWCRVDTDGVFEFGGRRYCIDSGEIQYQPIETDIGLLYDMDRILATETGDFYDMRYEKVKAREF